VFSGCSLFDYYVIVSIVMWSALLAHDGTLIYKRHHSLPMSVDSDDTAASVGTQSATGQYVIS